MKALLIAATLLLLVLHQDFWFWKDRTLLFGFLPVGLAYHMAYCVAACLLLWALVRHAWPRDLEER